MRMELFEEAIVFFKASLEIDETYVTSSFNIGYILNVMEKYDEAIPYFEHCLKEAKNKKDTSVKNDLFSLGYAYYYNNNYDMAGYYFKEALKVGKTDKKTKKYLRNVKARLRGKKVRQIEPEKFEIEKPFMIINKKSIKQIIEEIVVYISIIFIIYCAIWYMANR